MAWIKLQIHPEHDKVLALADLTGATPERVFAAAVRWFRWADEHAEDASIGLSRRAFREVTRWKGDGLADAMLHERVDWLTEEDGVLSPTRWETHMSRGAKVRALDASRERRGKKSRSKPDERPVGVPESDGTKKVLDESKRREEQDKDQESSSRGRASEPPDKPPRTIAVTFSAIHDAAMAERPQGEAINPDFNAVRDALVAAGFDRGRAYTLANRPESTLDRVTWLIERARASDHAGAMGLIVRGIQRPEEYPIERLTVAESTAAADGIADGIRRAEARRAKQGAAQ